MKKRYEDLLLKEVKELLKKSPPNVRIRVYYDSEEGQVVDIVKPIKRKPTLSQRLDELTTLVKDGFKQVNERIDNLERETNARFDRVESRLDLVERRLDYNNLKKLPESR